MTSTDLTPTERVYQLLRATVLEVPTDDATPAETADAMLCLALDFAEAVTDPVTIARVMTRQAERYFAKASGNARDPVTAPAGMDVDLRQTFAAAVVLARRQHADPVIQAVMLGYVVRWIENTAGRLEAASQLYAYADMLATPRGAASAARTRPN